MEQKIQYIVSVGTAFDGLTVYGPFEDIDLATEWASENDNGEPWEIAEVHEAL